MFTSAVRGDWELDRWTGAASAVLWMRNRFVVVKRYQKAKLLIYWSIYIYIHTYGHKLWVMTKRMRLRLQEAKMSFLCRVARLLKIR